MVAVIGKEVDKTKADNWNENKFIKDCRDYPMVNWKRVGCGQIKKGNYFDDKIYYLCKPIRLTYLVHPTLNIVLTGSPHLPPIIRDLNLGIGTHSMRDITDIHLLLGGENSETKSKLFETTFLVMAKTPTKKFIEGEKVEYPYEEVTRLHNTQGFLHPDERLSLQGVNDANKHRATKWLTLCSLCLIFNTTRLPWRTMKKLFDHTKLNNTPQRVSVDLLRAIHYNNMAELFKLFNQHSVTVIKFDDSLAKDVVTAWNKPMFTYICEGVFGQHLPPRIIKQQTRDKKPKKDKHSRYCTALDFLLFYPLTVGRFSTPPDDNREQRKLYNPNEWIEGTDKQKSNNTMTAKIAKAWNGYKHGPPSCIEKSGLECFRQLLMDTELDQKGYLFLQEGGNVLKTEHPENAKQRAE